MQDAHLHAQDDNRGNQADHGQNGPQEYPEDEEVAVLRGLPGQALPVNPQVRQRPQRHGDHGLEQLLEPTARSEKDHHEGQKRQDVIERDPGRQAHKRGGGQHGVHNAQHLRNNRQPAEQLTSGTCTCGDHQVADGAFHQPAPHGRQLRERVDVRVLPPHGQKAIQAKQPLDRQGKGVARERVLPPRLIGLIPAPVRVHGVEPLRDARTLLPPLRDNNKLRGRDHWIVDIHRVGQGLHLPALRRDLQHHLRTLVQLGHITQAALERRVLLRHLVVPRAGKRPAPLQNLLAHIARDAERVVHLPRDALRPVEAALIVIDDLLLPRRVARTVIARGLGPARGHRLARGQARDAAPNAAPLMGCCPHVGLHHPRGEAVNAGVLEHTIDQGVPIELSHVRPAALGRSLAQVAQVCDGHADLPARAADVALALEPGLIMNTEGDDDVVVVRPLDGLLIRHGGRHLYPIAHFGQVGLNRPCGLQLHLLLVPIDARLDERHGLHHPRCGLIAGQGDEVPALTQGIENARPCGWVCQCVVEPNPRIRGPARARLGRVEHDVLPRIQA